MTSGTIPNRAVGTSRGTLPASSAPRVVALSSSLLTERMLRFTSFADVIADRADLEVWSSSALPSDDVAGALPTAAFPQIEPFREFPHNYLRRLNDFAWDARHRLACRESMMEHVRQHRVRRSIRALRLPARVLTAAGLEQPFERWLERRLLAYERSPEATRRLAQRRPDVLFTTGPHRYEEPAVVASAKRLGIPTLALITSWDNLTTKNRMPFRHDGYVVWSEGMRDELHELYPASRDVPTYAVGAPQFDVFFRDGYHESRAAFCVRVGLDPARPFILYALGSPNFLREHHGAVFLAERLARGELGDVQLLVRPHPLFDNGEEARAFDRFGPDVRVQRTGQVGTPTAARSQREADIVDWVNSFRHADVVVNLSSTATVDASICDRPVVNLDYDPEPGQPNQALVRDVNHRWPHFKPVAESEGLWLVDSPAAMVAAVRRYLATPELHREGRRWIARHVCGYVDGRSGERMAHAVLDFAAQARHATRRPA